MSADRGREKLTGDDFVKLARLDRGGFFVFQPTGKTYVEYGNLIDHGLVTVRDIGGEQETVLRVEITKAGRSALSRPSSTGETHEG